MFEIAAGIVIAYFAILLIRHVIEKVRRARTYKGPKQRPIIDLQQPIRKTQQERIAIRLRRFRIASLLIFVGVTLSVYSQVTAEADKLALFLASLSLLMTAGDIKVSNENKSRLAKERKNLA